MNFTVCCLSHLISKHCLSSTEMETRCRFKWDENMLLTGSRFLEARNFESMYFLYILKGKTMFQNQKMFLKGVLVTQSTHQRVLSVITQKVKNCCSELWKSSLYQLSQKRESYIENTWTLACVSVILVKHHSLSFRLQRTLPYTLKSEHIHEFSNVLV